MKQGNCTWPVSVKTKSQQQKLLTNLRTQIKDQKLITDLHSWKYSFEIKQTNKKYHLFIKIKLKLQSKI